MINTKNNFTKPLPCIVLCDDNIFKKRRKYKTFDKFIGKWLKHIFKKMKNFTLF